MPADLPSIFALLRNLGAGASFASRPRCSGPRSRTLHSPAPARCEDCKNGLEQYCNPTGPVW